MRIGNRRFERRNKTYIMGILNVTPDSFSDGGRWNDMDRALRHVEQMLDEGMDILDVGGESTRPGYAPVSAEEETERVVPIIRAVKSRFDVPVSLDTYKAGVAREGIAAGADMINDIWGLKADEDMASVIAQGGVACCLMHNRREAVYDDFLRDVVKDLEESVRLAQTAGIPRDGIVLDPGVGFAKSYEQNLAVMRGMKQLADALDYPILLGCSRKSVVGMTLHVPVEERLIGTLATTAAAVMQGCSFVRVHDVKENLQVIQMTEAILYGKDKGGMRDEQR